MHLKYPANSVGYFFSREVIDTWRYSALERRLLAYFVEKAVAEASIVVAILAVRVS